MATRKEYEGNGVFGDKVTLRRKDKEGMCLHYDRGPWGLAEKPDGAVQGFMLWTGVELSSVRMRVWEVMTECGRFYLGQCFSERKEEGNWKAGRRCNGNID